MHKKYYFATVFILFGILTGILAFTGLNQVGFYNRGKVPIIAVICSSGVFIVGGLLFIVFGGKNNQSRPK